MRIQVKGTDAELVAHAEVSRLLLDDLLAQARARGPEPLARSAAGEGPGAGTIVARLEAVWTAAYRRQMVAMLRDIRARLAAMPNTLGGPAAATGGPDGAV